MADSKKKTASPSPRSTAAAGRRADQRQTLIGLGLNKIRRTKTLEDTPEVRGMISTVKHLVQVDEG